jgi:KTSC domain
MAVSRARLKVHADQLADEFQHDLGPWTQAPRSTRVQAYRYDYLNRALQVTWRNNKNHGYVYEDVPYESYRSFARAASKGRYVNNALNGFAYRLMDPDEVQADSNSERNPLKSRTR